MRADRRAVLRRGPATGVGDVSRTYLPPRMPRADGEGLHVSGPAGRGTGAASPAAGGARTAPRLRARRHDGVAAGIDRARSLARAQSFRALGIARTRGALPHVGRSW